MRIGSNPRQGGIALVTALLIVALASLVAVRLFHAQQLQVRSATNQVLAEQGLQHFRSAEAWLKEVLRQDAQDNTTDHRSDLWGTEVPIVQVPQGGFVPRVEDLQGRINLNNLVTGSAANTTQVDLFQRLLGALNLDPNLAFAVVDWIDPDGLPSGVYGVEDGEYRLRVPSYRAANRPLTSTEELAAIAGFDTEVRQRLAPHIAALPAPPSVNAGRHSGPAATTLINVNTASEPVLRSLSPVMMTLDLGLLIEQRDVENGFDTVNAFMTTLDRLYPQTPPVSQSLDSQLLDVASSYFLFQFDGQVEQVRLRYHSLLYRDGSRQTLTLSRARGL
ncbi:MAG: type II secretion system minor pseudopilin GspK [Pseudomonadota bacterium]|nr:type II secretion system minor pseudopilin GspK [Pseudomonadota bacterium]